jgi:hypothetical protein
MAVPWPFIYLPIAARQFCRITSRASSPGTAGTTRVSSRRPSDATSNPIKVNGRSLPALVSPSLSNAVGAPIASGVVVIVEHGDVGMVQRRKHLRFAAEPGEPIGIGRHAIGKDLQRDVAIEFGIAGAVDLAHAAFAQLRRNLVRTEPCSDHDCDPGSRPEPSEATPR